MREDSTNQVAGGSINEARTRIQGIPGVASPSAHVSCAMLTGHRTVKHSDQRRQSVATAKLGFQT